MSSTNQQSGNSNPISMGVAFPAALFGSTLIEIVLAMGLVVFGLLIVAMAIIESNRSNLRTNITATALNLLQSQVDKDARVSYGDLTNTNPPVESTQGLSEGTLTREVSELPTILGKVKHVRYVLTWKTTDIQTIQSEYELTEAGVAND